MTSASSGPIDVLVTGSAGFIGAALVERFTAEGLTVQGVDLRAGDAPTIRMDVTDGAQVLGLFRRLQPRTVVHAAAIVDDRGAPGAFQRVNVGGTENILAAAAVCDVDRLVQVSSIAALGLDPGKEADEHSPRVFDTGSPYFDTKAASEQLVVEAHAGGRVNAVIVRPGDVYGPGSQPWVERPLQMMRQRMPVLIAGGSGHIAHTWIDNLVDGIWLAATHADAPGGIFQFTDGVDGTTCREYFSRLAEAAGLAAPRVGLPKSAAVALALASESVSGVIGRPPAFTRGAVTYVCRQASYSIATSRRVLGYSPTVSLDEGMRRLAQTLRAGA